MNRRGWARQWTGPCLWLGAALTVATASAIAAETYRPSFHPDQLKGPSKGEPNRVLVLGSPHLSGLPDSFQAAMLEPLLQRLAEWQPTIITTENLSGLQCDALTRQPQRYADTIKNYCVDTSAAAKATGMSVPEANLAAEQMLAGWPDAPSPAQRRHLAALFLAAGEPASASVQWLQLDASERIADERLPADLVDYLNQRIERKNESYLVAAALAARLGLQRVYGVDDHSADWAPADEEAYGKAVMSAWDNPATKRRRQAGESKEQQLAQPDGLMAIYRAANQPAEAIAAFESDFGATLNEPSAQGYGRMYLGGWETRNLRMVANIREVLSRQPGSRLLTIVGSSHKGYYEAYLQQMHDVQLVDALSVLGTELNPAKTTE
ncbi:MAG: hypothetical protein KDI71_13095 [Xanthomonadales bacterium]|nr:hypothetical protein [Xanthomonadales bacterium]